MKVNFTDVSHAAIACLMGTIGVYGALRFIK